MGILLSEKLNRRKKKQGVFDFIDFENIYVVLGILFGLFISILGIIFVFFKLYFINNFDKFVSTIVDYNKNNIIIDGSTDQDGEFFKGLIAQEEFLKNTRKKVKKSSEIKQKDLVGKLNFALPDVLEKEFVVKFFEDLFLTISSKDSPVVLNSINIGSSTLNTLTLGNTESVNYRKYSVSLGFSCSDKEFDRVLDIIQVSGLFDKRYYFRGEILPIMTVSSVTMNFDKDLKNTGISSNTVDNIKSRSLQVFMYSYGDDKIELKK